MRECLHLVACIGRGRLRANSRLRQDPSVANLVDMYDEKGQLNDKVFSNTPVTASNLTRRQRESTFHELLGESETSDPDLAWAEQCIA